MTKCKVTKELINESFQGFYKTQYFGFIVPTYLITNYELRITNCLRHY
jgi:hypothetical protein